VKLALVRIVQASYPLLRSCLDVTADDFRRDASTETRMHAHDADHLIASVT